jgi:glyoxylase-like metal-dependent hydrolase (beta-lactamase superfamily II)
LPASARGPAIDPARGYRLQQLGAGLYMITDNAYQSMFMVYDKGVVVVDAPPSYASHILQAIAEVTSNPITHVVYSHSHRDHIGGTKLLGGHPVIIAQEETLRLLRRSADPARPPPTITFSDKYVLHVGDQVLELSYLGNAHEPGNILISAPEQRVLMFVDMVSPGWMPWRRFSVAQDLPAYISQIGAINEMDWDTLVGGHVSRTGTHADVSLQLAFMKDVRRAVASALETTQPGVGLNPRDLGNPWAYYQHYLDDVAGQCARSLAPVWAKQLGGFDVYVLDQCFAMEESLRME